MTNERNEIWIEDEPMSDKAQQIADIMRNMTIQERTQLMLEVLAHDADVMTGVRARMNWEIRVAIADSVGEHGDELDMDFLDTLYGQLLYKEVREIMPILFKDEYETFTPEIAEGE